MANIHFVPNKNKRIQDFSKPQNIYIRYKYGRKVDLYASIGFSVYLKENETGKPNSLGIPDWIDPINSDWDYTRQQVKNRTTIKNRVQINNLIKNLRNHFEDFESNLLQTGEIPTYKSARKHFEQFFKEPEKASLKKTLFIYIDEYINRPESQRELAKGTIKHIKLTRNFLKRFNDEVYKIDFDSINLEFYNDFVEWCENQNLSLNYIGKHIKTLKMFLNNALEDGVTNNVSFKSKRFKVLREPSENVYLSEDELEKIWLLDLSAEPQQENARDLFLIGAYTGLRVSDYNNLTEQHIIEVNGIKIIKIKTQKTKKEVAIPLHPIIEQILNKNKGKSPKKMPDQHINYKIKEVCESAGIDEITYTTKTIGGKVTTVKNYKFELIKTHTARRSFCTNAYLSGMQPMDIMAISGHTTEKAFLTYIKRTPEQTAIKMSQHPFFKKVDTLKAI